MRPLQSAPTVRHQKPAPGMTRSTLTVAPTTRPVNTVNHANTRQGRRRHVDGTSAATARLQFAPGGRSLCQRRPKRGASPPSVISTAPVRPAGFAAEPVEAHLGCQLQRPAAAVPVRSHCRRRRCQQLRPRASGPQRGKESPKSGRRPPSPQIMRELAFGASPGAGQRADRMRSEGAAVE